MAITKLSTNGIYGDKYGDIAANNNNWYEAIATTLVGSGGSATITFTNIPQDYTHLQIRGIGRSTVAGTGSEWLTISLNGGETAISYRHALLGNGTSASAEAGTQAWWANLLEGNVSNTFGVAVLDILDYKDTSKNKTLRTLFGYDANGSGSVGITSNLWPNTNAITSITLGCRIGNFSQNSRFSLYGLRA